MKHTHIISPSTASRTPSSNPSASHLTSSSNNRNTDFTIPGMLLVLGLQLQNNNQRIRDVRALLLATGMRLLGGLGVGLFLAPLFGLVGMAYNAGVLESSMPTAVLATILATEFDAEPAFVTTAVLTTTLLSPLTITPLLLFLVLEICAGFVYSPATRKHALLAR